MIFHGIIMAMAPPSVVLWACAGTELTLHSHAVASQLRGRNAGLASNVTHDLFATRFSSRMLERSKLPPSLHITCL